MKLPMPRDSFDVVTIHQVLHYLDDPAEALAEAARVLRPSGRLLIVDFAPHGLEFLREQHAHRRLGFSHETMRGWIEQAGLVLEEAIDLGARAGTRKIDGDALAGARSALCRRRGIVGVGDGVMSR